MPAKSPEPSKITLKFGGQKVSGSAAMSVDNEALKRQQDLVRAGSNGHRPGSGKPIILSRGLFICSHDGTGMPSLQRSSSDHAINGLKAEATNGMSPALTAIQMNGMNESIQSPSAVTMHMPPPTNLPTRLSGSPHPQAITNGAGPTSHVTATPFNSRIRQPGKGKKWPQLSLES
jgi:hypothetical protein